MNLIKMITIAICTVLYLTTAAHAVPGNGNGNGQGNGVGNGNGNHYGQHAPEIDVGAASSALALLVNALLLLHERRCRQ